MKKKLLACVVAAWSATGFAQSSVTLFGIIDTGLQFGSGAGAGASNKTRIGNSGNQSSQIGFRGSEDLGGGLSATFWLEGGLNTDDGTANASSTNNQPPGPTSVNQGLTFNRRSFVSLVGASWGELRLGREYTPQFRNTPAFDPFTANGVGTTQTLSSNQGGTTAVRASNSIIYLTPGCSVGVGCQGFYGELQHYRGENPSGTATTSDGTGSGLRAGYAAQGFNTALAVARTSFATGSIFSQNIGVSYDMTAVKLAALYSRDGVSGGVRGKGYMLAATAPVGAGLVKASYSTYESNAAGAPKSAKFAIGYVYGLSKRTFLYATAAHIRNSGGAAQSLNGAVTAPDKGSSGYDIGIRHSF